MSVLCLAVCVCICISSCFALLRLLDHGLARHECISISTYAHIPRSPLVSPYVCLLVCLSVCLTSHFSPFPPFFPIYFSLSSSLVCDSLWVLSLFRSGCSSLSLSAAHTLCVHMCAYVCPYHAIPHPRVCVSLHVLSRALSFLSRSLSSPCVGRFLSGYIFVSTSFCSFAQDEEQHDMSRMMRTGNGKRERERGVKHTAA